MGAVGEVYLPYLPNILDFRGCYWKKFKEKDITDRINGYIKINSCWFALDDVVLYNDENRIQNLKKKIEKNKEGKNVRN